MYDWRYIGNIKMSTKLNGYTLPDETINLMRSILSKSIQKGVESGFTLCSDQKNNLQARNICSGDSCAISVKEKCDKQEKFAGSYHTHPRSYSTASAGDLIYCGAIPNVCIGGEDNKIKCYTWKHNRTTEEKYNELVDKLNKGIKQIDDPVHEKTFECMKGFGYIVHTEKIVRENDKKVDILFSLIKMAEQEKIPEDKIDSMKESMKHLLGRRKKVVSEMNKNSAELIPSYYKEKILE
jgi:hypothetical protein